MPGSWGTFSQAGKPCRARGERFPRRENLAALRGNTFTGVETLLRFAATLLRAWKPCCILRQGFNDKLLAAIILCSPTSGRMRYAPTVGGEKLSRNDAIHHRIPQRTNSKNVGAYRIRPPQQRTCQKIGISRKSNGMLTAIIPYSPTSRRMRYAPTIGGEKLTLNDTSHQASPNQQIVNM